MTELLGKFSDVEIISSFIQCEINGKFPHVEMESYFDTEIDIKNFFGRSDYSFDWLQIYDMEVNSSIDMDVVTIDTNGDISDPRILLKESGEMNGYYPKQVILIGVFEDGTELPTIHV